ncbi:MAG: radical SAM protein, partial [Methanobacteriaceae archaeon]
MILGGTVVSSVEFSGKISLVIFLAKCPLRCSYCHNSEILDNGYEISNKEIFKIIDENSGFIDAVVVSGGEPLLQIESLIEILKYSRG